MAHQRQEVGLGAAGELGRLLRAQQRRLGLALQGDVAPQAGDPVTGQRHLARLDPAPAGQPVDLVDRKSTRLNSSTNAHLVCRLLLEKKKKTNKLQYAKHK